MKRFIVIAGNIGSGKSSLTELLARHYNCQPWYEMVNDNPYLPDFYRDMKTWSFHLQVFFLSKRFEHHQRIVNSPFSAVQDRSIYEDATIFARNLHAQGFMDTRDFENYQALFTVMTQFLRPPDLIIYIKASVPTLLSRIAQRGRDFEQGIRADYLAQLNELYDDWIGSFNLCPTLPLPGDDLDFIRHQGDFQGIIQAVERLFEPALPGIAKPADAYPLEPESAPLG